MLPEPYMDAVISRFGLKAEGPLRVRVDGPTGSLVLALLRQSDLVAALLLHSFRQVTNGDLTTYTKPALDKHQGVTKLVSNMAICETRLRPNIPCGDNVRKLRRVWGNLYCYWLKEHKLLINTDGVGTSCHVLQPEGTVLLTDD